MYTLFYILIIYHISQNNILSDGLEKRLRLILDEFLGPSHTTASKSIWDPLILVLSQYIFFIYLFLFLYVLYMLLLVTSIVSYFCILYRGLKSINF